ncbi:MAG: 5'-nucleotidase C-terminal domain-containing protein [Bacteroidales bacterium]|jgi:2',3'-cyclic-nucleotide 2'-phosphodiesterase/3'-nucleotidase|nr:5'-nucleotidase C-terminal domain-containing protein [Bacteroidales bacterium]
MKRIFVLAFILLSVAACGPKNGDYTIQILTTNDVHGSWFDSTYVGKGIKNSLFAVNTYADSIRSEYGAGNVVLLDAGDCLQGDNAPYFYNYVDTVAPHLFPRLVKYMGYDAVVVGNHDVETGHNVYDRVAGQLKSEGIPFLGGNAIRNDNGKPYFPVYKVIKRGGLKICILGFTNPNMKEWLDESLWSGMTFKSLIPLVQEDVDAVVAKEKPQIVIVAIHSGTGKGDGTILESQGLDLYKSLHGVDFVICSHDHHPYVTSKERCCLINAGSHARYLGQGTIKVFIRHHKIDAKIISGKLIPVKAEKVDTVMRNRFHNDYEEVKAFTLRKVGTLASDLYTKESYSGMCGYMNLIHSLSLSSTHADVSFAAPLTYDGHVDAGTLVYNDLFTIYPYENQLYVVKMTGKEIKDYLEYSYDQWINTIHRPSDHLLKIAKGTDHGFSRNRWHFVGRSYNFDSAGGLDYTVDVTKQKGYRISISSMADGSGFDPGKVYDVAMTSYRASGGGGLLEKGAGIDTDKIDSRITARYPEMRKLLYDYLIKNKRIDSSITGDTKLIGAWNFVPEKIACIAMKTDMNLLFGKSDAD